MEQETKIFFDVWQFAMLISAVSAVTISFIFYLQYYLRIGSMRDSKLKFDYVSKKTIGMLKFISILIGIAVATGFNYYLGSDQSLDSKSISFFTRLFISVPIGVIIVYVDFLILNFYYPTVLNRRLNKLRYSPRVSKAGNKMRLLQENEEDVHLDEGMQAEENIFSVDYDVWVDDVSGEVKIEKYHGHFQYYRCGNCGFETSKVTREEITKKPGLDSAGEITRHFKCAYCTSLSVAKIPLSITREIDYKALVQQNQLSVDRV